MQQSGRPLAEIACELIDVRLTDFRPEVFAKHEFANLFHYLNRARVVESFLEQAPAIRCPMPGG